MFAPKSKQTKNSQGFSENVYGKNCKVFPPFNSLFARQNLRCVFFFCKMPPNERANNTNACENLSLGLYALCMRKYTLCSI